MIRVLVLAIGLSVISCHQVLEWQPGTLSDTSSVTIVCDAEQGNRGLMDCHERVYVYAGVITDASDSPYVWRYIKFNWNTTDSRALAQPTGSNKWIYKIANIRKFFGVPNDEEIMQIAILFRSPERKNSIEMVQRNSDGTDLLIPVTNNTTTPDQ